MHMLNVQVLFPKFWEKLWRHCVKSVQIRSFFWFVFSRIRTEYGDLRIFSQNTGKYGTEKNSVFGHFSHTAVSERFLDD